MGCHFHVTTGRGVVSWTWGVKSNRLLERVTPAPLLGSGGRCGRSYAMSDLIPASGFGAGSARAAGSGLVSSVTGSGGRPRGLARAVQRELEWTAGRGDVVRAVDAARAELTNQAMGNVGNLVMTGQALVQVAPESAPYLEALLGAYATGAAQAIARFQ